jgi:hypothetical protein
MNPNYPYPKSEYEFYSRQYSVDQLIKNYSFQHLMAYYFFGVNVLAKLNYIADNNLYEMVDQSPDKIWDDKMYFILRTAIVKNAIQNIERCQVHSHSNMVFVHYLN